MAEKLSEARLRARLRAVEDHFRGEQEHDPQQVLASFGPVAEWVDQATGRRYVGHEHVRSHYAQLFESFPDFRVDVRKLHVATDAIIAEVELQGTHSGHWNGIAATDRYVQFPVCSVFTFDEQDRLSSEAVYYDRANVMEQLGLLAENLKKERV